MTEEDIDRWERLFRHKFPKTEFGPPNEWPALIALARKGRLWENQEQMIKEYDADNTPTSLLVERLRDPDNITADGSTDGQFRAYEAVMREAAAALERMERRLANQRETIGDFRETIAGLRSELKMTRDEWDYYKEQYRKATEARPESPLVERLRHTRVDALTPIYSLLNEAADALERMEKELGTRNWFTNQEETIAALRAENERLTKDLKNAVWSDSEECKMLTESNAALRSALEKILERTDADVATMPEHDLIRFIRQICRAALGNGGDEK